MSIDIPPDWVEVDRAEFERLIKDVNWVKDDFGFTVASKWDGVNDRRIGFGDDFHQLNPTLDGRYFVDPTFFNP